jgi:hypothetical protein
LDHNCCEPSTDCGRWDLPVVLEAVEEERNIGEHHLHHHRDESSIPDELGEPDADLEALRRSLALVLLQFVFRCRGRVAFAICASTLPEGSALVVAACEPGGSGSSVT